MSVYSNIDYILTEKKMSRRKLAQMANIKETTLAACFARRPEHFPLKYAKAISEVLGVGLDTIYGWTTDTCGNTTPAGFHNDIGNQSRERILLETFWKMNRVGQNTLIDRATEMLEVKKFVELNTEQQAEEQNVVTRDDL